jgi:hypothetical protein
VVAGHELVVQAVPLVVDRLKKKRQISKGRNPGRLHGSRPVPRRATSTITIAKRKLNQKTYLGNLIAPLEAVVGFRGGGGQEGVEVGKE